jgi:uncharacterized Fe-S cluster protein YjdI
MVEDPAQAGAPRTGGVTRSYGDAGFRVLWDATRCIHTGICLRRLPEVFDVNARPWVRLDGASEEAVAEAIRACPTGALRYDGDRLPPEAADEPTTVTVRPNGPFYVRGRIRIQGRAGAVIAEENRVALCRCGASQNKPFCDNSHQLVQFRD